MTVLTDNFNRANNYTISTALGANWTAQLGSAGGATADQFCIDSNTAQPVNISNGVTTFADTDCGAFYSGSTWTNDQYAKCALTTVGGTSGDGSGPGLCVRMSGTPKLNSTGYRVFADHGGANNIELNKAVAGSSTILANYTQAFTDGDLFEIDVLGTTVTFKYVTGSTTLGSVTDSSISSGAPGIQYSSALGANNTRIDNWEGGDIASGLPPGLGPAGEMEMATQSAISSMMR